MTQEQLARLARLLGDKFAAVEDAPRRIWSVQRLGDWMGDRMSDGDLLLALLNRCAELGHQIVLEALWRDELNEQPIFFGWSALLPNKCRSECQTALEAVIFVALRLPEARV